MLNRDLAFELRYDGHPLSVLVEAAGTQTYEMPARLQVEIQAALDAALYADEFAAGDIYVSVEEGSFVVKQVSLELDASEKAAFETALADRRTEGMLDGDAPHRVDHPQHMDPALVHLRTSRNQAEAELLQDG